MQPGVPMPKTKPEAAIAADLIVQERVLLFCLASHTDWVRAGVTHATAQVVLIKDLVERDHKDGFALTEDGRAALFALLADAYDS
jgi:hypothetical protein